MKLWGDAMRCYAPRTKTMGFASLHRSFWQSSLEWPIWSNLVCLQALHPNDYQCRRRKQEELGLVTLTSTAQQLHQPSPHESHINLTFSFNVSTTWQLIQHCKTEEPSHSTSLIQNWLIAWKSTMPSSRVTWCSPRPIIGTDSSQTFYDKMPFTQT